MTDINKASSSTKKAMRRLLQVGLGVGVAAAVTFAGVAFYNSFDEEMGAEAKALLAPPPMGRIDDQNGFVAMLGMRAPMGEDQMAWGRKVAEAYAAQAAPGFVRTDEWKSRVKRQLSATKQAVWCRPAEKDCITQARSNAAALAAVLASEQNAEILKRYQKVRELPEFGEIYVGSDPLADIVSSVELHEGAFLARLDIALKVTRGEMDAAIAELEREALFHRRLVTQGRMLLTAMVGIASLGNDLLLASEMLRSGGEAIAQYRARMLEIAAFPLKAGVLATVVRNEAHWNLSAFYNTLQTGNLNWANLLENDMSPLPRWALPYLLRPNESANIMARLTALEVGVAEAAAPEFEDRVKARAPMRGALLERRWYSEFHNPVGRRLAEGFGFNASSYISRLHDLDTLSRMVRLQATLGQQSITESAAIAAYVAGEGAKTYADPYTGKHFAFDLATRQLSFEPRSKESWSKALIKRYKKAALIL